MATPTVKKAIPIEQSVVMELAIFNAGTYATGGVAVDTTGDIEWTHAIVQPTAGYVGEYDPSTKKVKVYRQKDPAAAGGADIALPEVANSVDLSAVNFLVVGFRPT